MKKFTLIELLVVLGIIGILVTILLPGLANARKKAKVAVCVSNNRQISQALTLYCHNNSQFTPSKWYNGQLTNGIKPGHGYVGIKTANITFKYRSLNEYLGIAHGSSEVDDLMVAKCPLDDHACFRDGPDYNSFYQFSGHSYMGNARDNNGKGLNDGDYGFPVTAVQSPSRMVATQEVGGWHYAWGFSEKASHSWHNSYKYGVSFLDGHAQNLRILKNTLSTSKYTFDRND